MSARHALISAIADIVYRWEVGGREDFPEEVAERILSRLFSDKRIHEVLRESAHLSGEALKVDDGAAHA